jgi:hypothetical protein
VVSLYLACGASTAAVVATRISPGGIFPAERHAHHYGYEQENIYGFFWIHPFNSVLQLNVTLFITVIFLNFRPAFYDIDDSKERQVLPSDKALP